jgi:hypothetical protein
MELRLKPIIMLLQISWPTYAVSVVLLVAIYYLYIGLTFYGPNIRSAISRLGGNYPASLISGEQYLQTPDHTIMGKAQPENVELVAQEELSFAPSDLPDDDEPEYQGHSFATGNINSRLAGSFAEMIAEVRILIRVISESGESKEKFEILFRLIIQKYPELEGTTYQQQVNDFLLSEGASQSSFELNIAELDSYWTK